MLFDCCLRFLDFQFDPFEMQTPKNSLTQIIVSASNHSFSQSPVSSSLTSSSLLSSSSSSSSSSALSALFSPQVNEVEEEEELGDTWTLTFSSCSLASSSSSSPYSSNPPSSRHARKIEVLGHQHNFR